MFRSEEMIQEAKNRQVSHQQYIEEHATGQQLPRVERARLLPLFVGLVGLMVLFLLLTGCATEAAVAAAMAEVKETAAVEVVEALDVVTTAHLMSTWVIYDYGYTSFIQLNADYTFQRDHSGKMEAGQVLDYGQWSFDGQILTLTSSEEIVNCNGQLTGKYLLWVQPYDGIFFKQIEESCDGRLGFGWETDYAPIQAEGKMCRTDSVAFCDAYIGYDADDVLQPKAREAKDKVLPPSEDRPANRDMTDVVPSTQTKHSSQEDGHNFLQD